VLKPLTVGQRYWPKEDWLNEQLVRMHEVVGETFEQMLNGLLQTEADDRRSGSAGVLDNTSARCIPRRAR
jgi:hypothetical protein